MYAVDDAPCAPVTLMYADKYEKWKNRTAGARDRHRAKEGKERGAERERNQSQKKRNGVHRIRPADARFFFFFLPVFFTPAASDDHGARRVRLPLMSIGPHLGIEIRASTSVNRHKVNLQKRMRTRARARARTLGNGILARRPCGKAQTAEKRCRARARAHRSEDKS